VPRGVHEQGKQTMKQNYDRAVDDVGNIVSLEHVNVCVPDQGLATSF
jgi:hydrogenase maturation factor